MSKTKGIIAAGNPATAEAAAIALEAGGNAFDAAVAAKFASFIGEPCMSSPGGGGFMTAMTADRKKVFFDFFVQTPQVKQAPEKTDFLPIVIDFGDATETFYVGMGAAGVPGSIAGIFEIYDHFCTLPLRTLAEPAIQMARDGVVVDAFQAHDFQLLAPILDLHPEARKIFRPGGDLLVEGQTIRIPELADFLDTLVIEGKDLFYRGEIAAMIAEDGLNLQGSLSREDFGNYQVAMRNPLEFRYGRHPVITNPPPSIGGGLMAIGLENMWPDATITPNYPPNSAEHSAHLAASLARIDAVHLNDELLRRELNRLSGGGFRPAGEALGGTTHFSIMDEWGNAVAISTSNGEGNGYVPKGTGFMMNNMLGETALLPDGLHSWKPNERLSSMMAPTLVCDEAGLPILAMGTGGAGRIPSVLLQVLHYHLDLGLPIEQAIDAPRMHWRKNVLNLEPGWEIGRLVPEPHEILPWTKPDMFFGGVHAVSFSKGAFHGVGDARRCGVVREIK